MKNKILMIAVMFSLILGTIVNDPAASVTVRAATAKSDGSNMKKVLKYYKKKQYSTAQKYNKKLSEYASEPCVSRMSAAMKKAYRKVVRKYGTSLYSPKAHIEGYYLTDIDNDGKTDLVVRAGTCEGDMRIHVYQYLRGKIKKIGSMEAIHMNIYAYPNHDGIVGYSGLTQSEYIGVIKIKKGKLRWESFGSRENVNPYFSPRCVLESHVNADFSADIARVDYSPLG